jgi:hypothetical protein
MVIKSWADIVAYIVLVAFGIAFCLMLTGFAIVFIEAYRSPNRREKFLSLVSKNRGFHLFHPRGPSLIYRGAAITLVAGIVFIKTMFIFAAGLR